jgi:hypothetical protein
MARRVSIDAKLPAASGIVAGADELPRRPRAHAVRRSVTPVRSALELAVEQRWQLEDEEAQRHQHQSSSR